MVKLRHLSSPDRLMIPVKNLCMTVDKRYMILNQIEPSTFELRSNMNPIIKMLTYETIKNSIKDDNPKN